MVVKQLDCVVVVAFPQSLADPWVVVGGDDSSWVVACEV